MSESEVTVDKKLSEIFDEGYELFKELETTSLPFNGKEFQEKVKKCTDLFEDSTRLVSLCGMFSSNESIEEIATECLRYLLLPFFLGQLITKSLKHDREEILKTAKIYYKDFLKRCEEYEIYKPTSTGIEQSVSEEDPGIRNLVAQASERNNKIKQYRERKELEEQVNELKLFKEDHIDDEVKRDFYMKMLKLSIMNTQEELVSIDQELEILSFRKSLPKNEVKHNTSHNNVKKVEPLKPIIITKDIAQKTVFGMGYPSLPVMTVKEFYEERVREGIFPNAEQVVEMNAKMFQRQDSAEKEDQENAEKELLVENDDPEYLQRQRAADEYKDEVRRGDGNRYNRS